MSASSNLTETPTTPTPAPSSRRSKSRTTPLFLTSALSATASFKSEPRTANKKILSPETPVENAATVPESIASPHSLHSSSSPRSSNGITADEPVFKSPGKVRPSSSTEKKEHVFKSGSSVDAILKKLHQLSSSDLARVEVALEGLVYDKSADPCRAFFGWCDAYAGNLPYRQLKDTLRRPGGREGEYVEVVLAHALEDVARRANMSSAPGATTTTTMKTTTTSTQTVASEECPYRELYCDPTGLLKAIHLQKLRPRELTKARASLTPEPPSSKTKKKSMDKEKAEDKEEDIVEEEKDKEEKKRPMSQLIYKTNTKCELNTLYKPMHDQGIDLFMLWEREAEGAQAVSSDCSPTASSPEGVPPLRSLGLTCIQLKYGTTQLGYADKKERNSHALQTIRKRFNAGRDSLLQSLIAGKVITAQEAEILRPEAHYVLIAPGGCRPVVYEDKSHIRRSTRAGIVEITIPSPLLHAALFHDVAHNLLDGLPGKVLKGLRGNELAEAQATYDEFVTSKLVDTTTTTTISTGEQRAT